MMNKNPLDLLLNDYYKTLKVLYENQIKIDNDIFSYLLNK